MATSRDPVLDPRRGDIEDDLSSTKQRSMLALAGGLLVEISLIKLITAWVLLLLVPGIVLGLAPIVATEWLHLARQRLVTAPWSGVLPVALLFAVLALAWYGARPLLRVAEASFWSLTSIVVEPAYVGAREIIRHFAERRLSAGAPGRLSRLRAMSALASGLLIFVLAVLVVRQVWPATHLFSGVREIGSAGRLFKVALANSAIIVAGYLALGSLAWGLADATMAAPLDFTGFAAPTSRPRWRVVHLSDIHVVGERFGFRIESGRLGPRGNERLRRVLALIEDLDRQERIDLVLISGDITDAGRSAEWAEFFAALEPYPELGERLLIIPGNHDLNVIDRANPARMDLPTSPLRRLRRLRVLSAIAAVQGRRVRVVDRKKGALSATLEELLAPHRDTLQRFADAGRPRLSPLYAELWNSAFPMVRVPATADGLGVILLNSNAATHFSFTNALGMISSEQVHAMDAVKARYPAARWIIALHHHVVEYPQPAKALFERIGTALVNGNWFIRRLKPFAGRTVLMHGHRHVDWIGDCGGVPIVSAPSPVMEATDDRPTYFYLHTLTLGERGELTLMQPLRVDVPPC